MNTFKRNIFSFFGVAPELAGYAIARFSRTHKSLKDLILELSQKDASNFYKTFYFKYKHNSVADLALGIFLFENVSNIAREFLWAHPLLSGMESSTRYLNFKERGVHLPEEIKNTRFQKDFEVLAEKMINSYYEFYLKLKDYFYKKFEKNHPKKKAENLANNKAFDVARYLLPAGHYTNLGLIMSARTFEDLVSNLLVHPLKEVREIAKELQSTAACKKAFVPFEQNLNILFEKLSKNKKLKPLLKNIKKHLPTNLKIFPTIATFVQPNNYRKKTLEKIEQWASKNIKFKKIEDLCDKKVVLVKPHSLETEILTTFLYKKTPFSYTQLLNFVESLSKKKRLELFDLIYSEREEGDKLLEEVSSGYRLIFDICSDFGAHKDLHRHRRCIEIAKDFNSLFGYETPIIIKEMGLDKEYQNLMNRVQNFARRLESSKEKPLALSSGYLLGYGFRRRFLLKMDAFELQYIVELRTRSEGHFAYREIAYLMYQEFKKRFPNQAKFIKAINPYEK